MRRLTRFLGAIGLGALLAMATSLIPTPLGAACTNTTNIALCKSGHGDADWDTNLNRNFDTIDGAFGSLYSGRVYAVDYGVVCDGSTDNTTAIAAALAATPTNGILRFPSSALSCKFTTFTVTSGRVLEGSDTILESTKTTSGPAVTFYDGGSISRYRIIGITIKGPATGTSSGVSIRDTVASSFDEMWIRDFGGVALTLNNVQDSTFKSLRLKNSTTGMAVQVDVNQNVFINTEVQKDSASAQRVSTGINFTGGAGNAFYGGLMQNISGNGVLMASGVENNAFYDWWFESNSMSGYDIDLAAGSSANYFTNIHRSGSPTDPDGGYRDAGNGNKLRGGRWYGGRVTIENTSRNAEIADLANPGLPYFVYTDNGAKTLWREVDGSTQLLRVNATAAAPNILGLENLGAAATSTGVQLLVNLNRTTGGKTAFGLQRFISDDVGNATYGGHWEFWSSKGGALAKALSLDGANASVYGTFSVGAGAAIVKHLSATARLDFAAWAGTDCQDKTISVTGAADGDTVSLGIPTALASVAGVTWTGWVSGSGTVTVRGCKITAGGSANPGAATVRADVWQH